jgi:hypothetical protein
LIPSFITPPELPMQIQTTSQDQDLVKDQDAGPVEIDTNLLHLVGGGNPKGTWGVVPTSTEASTLGGGDSNPKGTW